MAKDEFQPLFDKGFHALLLDEMRQRCVLDFPDSTRRPEIMAGFETVVEQMLKVGIEGRLWVDGSFTTEKIEPEDIDLLAVLPQQYRDSPTPEQSAFLDWLIDNDRDPKRSFHCDIDIVYELPPDSEWYEHLYASVVRYYETTVFGKSVSTNEPKGIVIFSVALPAVEQGEESENSENNEGRGDEHSGRVAAASSAD